MSKKNKKAKSKKNNKKRLAIILSSILGTGILATAITLPIVLTRKGGKDDGNTPGSLDYLDHFEKQIADISDLTNMDPHLDIFKDLTIDLTPESHNNDTSAIIKNIVDNSDDEASAQEKIIYFLKYLMFVSSITDTYTPIMNFFAGREDTCTFSGTIDYKLEDFRYEFNSNTFNFSYSNITTITTVFEGDWGKITTNTPTGKTSKIYINLVLTNKSKDVKTYDQGLFLTFNQIQKGKHWNNSIFSPSQTSGPSDSEFGEVIEETEFTNQDTGEKYIYSSKQHDNEFSDYCGGLHAQYFDTLYRQNEWKLSDTLKGINFIFKELN